MFVAKVMSAWLCAAVPDEPEVAPLLELELIPGMVSWPPPLELPETVEPLHPANARAAAS
jgi:hypothetical protein